MLKKIVLSMKKKDKNTEVSALPWELQNFSLVMFYGEALKSDVRSIPTMKLIWHYESYGLSELFILNDLIKRKAFKGFTFSIAWYFLWIANNELDQSPKAFEYYIVSLAPKAKTSFIFPSKAATEFSFWYKRCTPKNSSSVFDASPVISFTLNLCPKKNWLTRKRRKCRVL